MEQYLKRIKALPEEKQALFARQLEAWLAAHRDAGAVAKSLSVFYVTRDSVARDDLRAFLRDRLPTYLVPSEYVALESLPKTINGKVDRVALQCFQGASAENPFQRPVVLDDERERQVVEIWTRILGVHAINRNSNFFELGGHSLLATQVIMEIEQSLGVEIPLGIIFKYPTIAQLCEHLASLPKTGSKADRNTVKVSTAAASTHAPLSTAQRRLWYAAQLSDGGLEYKLVKVIDMRGPLNVSTLTQSATEIVNRHETLRTCFGYVAGELAQKINPPRPFSIEHVDLTGLPLSLTQSVSEAIQENILHQSFDLETEPGMRMTLLWFSATHTRLIVDLHHIVVDGWSVGLLVRELNALFRSFSQGHPSDLEPLPLQFRDVVVHEKRRLSQPRLDEQLAYWRSQLTNVPYLEFPHAQPSRNGNSGDGEIEIALGADVSVRIDEACNRLQITPFMFLMSVYHVMLQLHSDAYDIAIATDVANREARDHSNLIGFFVNQVVLRIAATSGLTFAQLCHRTRAAVVDAFANKDVPFEMVLREVRPQSNKTQSPLTRAMFSFHHVLPDLSIEGLDVQLIDVKPPVTKYSLLLNMEEGANGLHGSIEYSGSVFDRTTIQRMADDFTVIGNYATNDLNAPLTVLREAALAATHECEQRGIRKMRAERRRDLGRFLAGQTSVQPVLNNNR